jgi:threonine/homoserine/homoserine lactone efflux protein
VPESLRAELLREVEKLENVPEKDWHPGSNGLVLDLVHPSLFCFVAGVTPQTTNPAHPPFAHIGSGEVFSLFSLSFFPSCPFLHN